MSDTGVGICAELGRCAYDAAENEPDSGCPWWADCFGLTNEPTEEADDE